MDAAQTIVEERVRQEKQANPKVHPYYVTIHKVGCPNVSCREVAPTHEDARMSSRAS